MWMEYERSGAACWVMRTRVESGEGRDVEGTMGGRREGSLLYGHGGMMLCGCDDFE